MCVVLLRPVMIRELKKILPATASVLVLYAMVIVYQGYTYGIHDQSEILPVIYSMAHQGYYPLDLYVQSYLDAGVTERTVFQFIYRWVGYSSPWVTFFWHLVVSCSLILGLLKIASLLIRNAFFQILAIGVLLTLGHHFSLGGNELYYSSLTPGLCAKSLAVWGIYYWLKRNYMLWSVFLILSTYLQPVTGLQVLLITSMSLVAGAVLHSNFKTFPLKAWAIYVVLCTPWLLLLYLNNGISGDPAFFKKIIEFRLSNHFIPTKFSISGWLFTIAMALISMAAFKGNIRRFCFIIVAGCFLYFILYKNLNWVHVTYSHWYNTTIWIEFFGIVALFRLMEKPVYDKKWIRKTGIVMPVFLLLLVSLYRFQLKPESNPQYSLPWFKDITPEVQISLLAKDLTQRDALFVAPYDLTAFSWYSKRSLYVNYRSMMSHEPFLRNWYDRMQQVYQYRAEDQEAGFKFSNFANAVFSTPAHESIMVWKQSGITHFICKTPNIEGKNPLGASPPYYIYETRIFTD